MLSIFNKNVIFQYKLAVVLAETRDLHLGKMRERFARKTSKILRKTSVSSINYNTSNRSSIVSNNSSNSRSRSSSNISIAKLAIIILILLNYGRKMRKKFSNTRKGGNTIAAQRCRYAG